MENLVRPTMLPADATPRRRLIPRVYAERSSTSFEALSYRIRKALMAGDQAAAAESYRLLDDAERDAFKKSLDDTVMTKGAWNRATRRYDLPDGQWSTAHPRPEQKPDEPAPTKPRLQIAPQTGSGFLHEIRRGSIVHFDLEGTRHHAKVLKWGKVGATVVTATGDVAAVTWADLKFGVAPESAVEAVAKSLSGAMPLYAMSPQERVRFFALREPADFEKSEPADEPPAPKPRRWQKFWQRIS